MLYSRELDETINFYTISIDFTVAKKNEKWGWASMNLGDIEIMVAKPNDHTHIEKPTFTGTFYFNINDVDDLWHELKDKCTIVYPIEDFEWNMREFAILDNNGYMLQFGQNIKAD